MTFEVTLMGNNPSDDFWNGMIVGSIIGSGNKASSGGGGSSGGCGGGLIVILVILVILGMIGSCAGC